jgi:hypothetical protein
MAKGAWVKKKGGDQEAKSHRSTEDAEDDEAQVVVQETRWLWTTADVAAFAE